MCVYVCVCVRVCVCVLDGTLIRACIQSLTYTRKTSNRKTVNERCTVFVARLLCATRKVNRALLIYRSTTLNL